MPAMYDNKNLLEKCKLSLDIKLAKLVIKLNMPHLSIQLV